MQQWQLRSSCNAATHTHTHTHTTHAPHTHRGTHVVEWAVVCSVQSSHSGVCSNTRVASGIENVTRALCSGADDTERKSKGGQCGHDGEGVRGCRERRVILRGEPLKPLTIQSCKFQIFRKRVCNFCGVFVGFSRTAGVVYADCVLSITVVYYYKRMFERSVHRD